MPTMSGLTRRQLLGSLSAAYVAQPFAHVAKLFRAARTAQTAGSPPIRVRTLNHFGLAVTDPKRSVDFYQGLFGMPVQARVDTTTILRVGAGPQFISIAPAAANAAPSINHYCLGIENFAVDRVLAALAAHGVTKGDAAGPMKVAVTMRDGTPNLLFGDPDGIVCQLQDVSYCGWIRPARETCAGLSRRRRRRSAQRSAI
jgi:catechol 2,3-dioxygenase-like lactoylglutathione lyase family enzyme